MNAEINDLEQLQILFAIKYGGQLLIEQVGIWWYLDDIDGFPIDAFKSEKVLLEFALYEYIS